MVKRIKYVRNPAQNRSGRAFKTGLNDIRFCYQADGGAEQIEEGL